MRKLSTLVFCLLFFGNLAMAQNKDKAKILEMLANQTKFWNEGNLEQFMAGYWKSDSLVFIGKSGLTYGFDKTLANYKKNYPDLATMGKLDFDIKKVEKINSKTYFVIGKWHLTRKEKGDIGGHYSLIFKKIKGVWVITSDHSS